MFRKRFVVRAASAVVVCGGAVIAFGCAGDQEAASAAAAKVEAVETQLTLLQTRITSIETRQFRDDLNDRSVAYLTPGSEGYQVIESGLGQFTVSLSNVEAYANGSRVTLTFGNLTTATIRDPKVTVEWGTTDSKGIADNQSQRSRSVEFTRELRPGAWNPEMSQ